MRQGVSGAGKTTLLDVLASRVSTGVVTGDMLVNGTLRDDSFQRKTGYVQQQDLHLATSTVREALSLSAVLRQPRHLSRKEKLDYVDTVIDLLEMHAYADAVVGFPGEGLNVEQRKRLTIGVELAAKPQLLLFLDEPTSGLDSQTSWSISSLMKKLTQSGQAILCTIHQPSAMLFQRFDRLLLLAKGGKTVYFGDIGDGAETLLGFFHRNGGPPCPEGANPAEYMLNVLTGSLGADSNLNWPEIWNNSPERKAVQKHLQELKQGSSAPSATPNDQASEGEFASPFIEQLWQVTKRVFQQYWRNPAYIYSKSILTVGAVCVPRGKDSFQLLILSLGIVYRVLFLQGPIYTTRPTEPDVRHLHLSGSCFADGHADHPLVCYAAYIVRGARATIQNV